MTTKSKDIIRRALSSAKGDDLERAERAFGGKTTVEMKAQFGASGKTCEQVLAEYRLDRAAVNLAIEEFEALAR